MTQHSAKHDPSPSHTSEYSTESPRSHLNGLWKIAGSRRTPVDPRLSIRRTIPLYRNTNGMSDDRTSNPAREMVPAMGVDQLSPANTSTSCESSATLAPSKQSLSHKSSRRDHPSTPSRPSRLAHMCLNLPPAFFSYNMGTGITSILLHNLPYNAGWLQRLGIVIFVLNVVIFALLVVGNLVRYIRWKGLMSSVNTHPLAGMFWGCLPMGFATIVVSPSIFLTGRQADRSRTWWHSSAYLPGDTDGHKSRWACGGSMSCYQFWSTSA